MEKLTTKKLSQNNKKLVFSKDNLNILIPNGTNYQNHFYNPLNCQGSS